MRRVSFIWPLVRAKLGPDAPLPHARNLPTKKFEDQTINRPLNVIPPVSSKLNLRAHRMPFSANHSLQKDLQIVATTEDS